MVNPKVSHQLPGVNTMSKEQKNRKENKKQPAMTPKEKKAAKKAKKDAMNGSRGLLD